MNSAPKIAEIDGLPALVVLTGGWQPEYLQVMQTEGLVALSIRVTRDDLGFLDGLRNLRGLVLNTSSVAGLKAIERLPHLETLTLNTPKRPRIDLNLACFPQLRRLGLYWNPGLESLFACSALEELYIFGPPDADLTRFGALRSLRRLELSEGRRLKATKGIDQLRQLAFLGLYFQSHLEALTGLGKVVSLRHLAIESCMNLNAIDEISRLVNLETLKVANCGDIASIAPLERLRCLERFFAWESTKVRDGDLAVLLRLPRLREVAMMSRRDYSPTVRQVEAALAQRHGDPRGSGSDGYTDEGR